MGETISATSGVAYSGQVYGKTWKFRERKYGQNHHRRTDGEYSNASQVEPKNTKGQKIPRYCFELCERAHRTQSTWQFATN